MCTVCTQRRVWPHSFANVQLPSSSRSAHHVEVRTSSSALPLDNSDSTASSSLSNVKAIVPDAPLHVFTSEPPVPGHAAFPVLARAPRTSQSVTRLTAPSSKPHYWAGEAPGTG
ncbi:hypothetical protein C8J57DRAFT_1705949 [Mycena rebaudengoi]|nr:hypothetical protein C8J57DRAFT_1705949 [Mycena rebaudengoi]